MKKRYYVLDNPEFRKVLDNPKRFLNYSEYNNEIIEYPMTFKLYIDWVCSASETNYSPSPQVMYFLESKGIYLLTRPELYSDGVNWNWQLWWYNPSEYWTDDNIDCGTFLYGDNGEYRTREEAELSAFYMAFGLLEAGLKTGTYKTK